jgi:hypothetical protein
MSDPNKLLKGMVMRALGRQRARRVIAITNEKRWIDPLGPHIASNAKPWGLAYLDRQQRRFEAGIHADYQSKHPKKSAVPVKITTPTKLFIVPEPEPAEPEKIEPGLPPTVESSLDAMTVASLKKLAKASGQISGYSKMKKAELITALCEYMGFEDNTESIEEGA